MNIKILIPIYNDWQSAFKLLEEINSILEVQEHNFSVLIINAENSWSFKIGKHHKEEMAGGVYTKLGDVS